RSPGLCPGDWTAFELRVDARVADPGRGSPGKGLRAIAASTDTAPATAKRDEDKIVIFDTTLRDGEQCPGATMTFEEKLQVAELLDDMGVDVIEAGFPIASEGDFEAVTEIAKLAKHSVICGLARANFADI